jgi:hypothetical protein
MTAYGGARPLKWHISSGSLPRGLQLSSSGTISGTPSTIGTFKFTVKVKDAKGHTAAKALSIEIT